MVPIIRARDSNSHRLGLALAHDFGEPGLCRVLATAAGDETQVLKN